MLVLTRSVGQQNVIGGDIFLTVTVIEGGKVRLGIEAPPSVSVDRAEIHERKMREKAELTANRCAVAAS
jgi:carbon storage regulator